MADTQKKIIIQSPEEIQAEIDLLRSIKDKENEEIELLQLEADAEAEAAANQPTPTPGPDTKVEEESFGTKVTKTIVTVTGSISEFLSNITGGWIPSVKDGGQGKVLLTDPLKKVAGIEPQPEVKTDKKSFQDAIDDSNDGESTLKKFDDQSTEEKRSINSTNEEVRVTTRPKEKVTVDIGHDHININDGLLHDHHPSNNDIVE